MKFPKFPKTNLICDLRFPTQIFLFVNFGQNIWLYSWNTQTIFEIAVPLSFNTENITISLQAPRVKTIFSRKASKFDFHIMLQTCRNTSNQDEIPTRNRVLFHRKSNLNQNRKFKFELWFVFYSAYFVYFVYFVYFKFVSTQTWNSWKLLANCCEFVGSIYYILYFESRWWKGNKHTNSWNIKFQKNFSGNSNRECT